MIHYYSKILYNWTGIIMDSSRRNSMYQSNDKQSKSKVQFVYSRASAKEQLPTFSMAAATIASTMAALQETPSTKFSTTSRTSVIRRDSFTGEPMLGDCCIPYSRYSYNPPRTTEGYRRPRVKETIPSPPKQKKDSLSLREILQPHVVRKSQLPSDFVLDMYHVPNTPEFNHLLELIKPVPKPKKGKKSSKCRGNCF